MFIEQVEAILLLYGRPAAHGRHGKSHIEAAPSSARPQNDLPNEEKPRSGLNTGRG